MYALQVETPEVGHMKSQINGSTDAGRHLRYLEEPSDFEILNWNYPKILNYQLLIQNGLQKQ